MTFKYDFFSNNIPNWKKILKPFKNKKNVKALEIGCFEGRATKWLLENVLTDETSRITVIDTFKGSIEHKDRGYKIKSLLNIFKENIKEYLKKVKIYKGLSSDILRNAKLEKYDIIYIDGSHVAKDVLEDAIISWKFLNKNGVMIFDDYEWNFYKDETMCPKIAIDSFLNVYKNQYKLINKNYQVYISKIGENVLNHKKRKILPIVINDEKFIKEINQLKQDLQKIQSSKTYKVWQKYNQFKKFFLKVKNKNE